MEQDDISNLDVLILCGGFGKRLKEIGQNCPKPMVEVNGRPFLEILIEHISSFGFRRFILCTGFKSGIIEQYYYKKNDGNTYVISKESEPLGTAGGIKNAEAHILSSSFIVFNGDSICQANLKEFSEFHKFHNASASITITTIDDVREYGSVVVGDKLEIILDGGVKRGTHVLKALAAGAKACSFGKMFLFSLSAGGQKGVEKLLQNIKDEIYRNMVLMGCKNLKELNSSKLIYRK